MCGIAGIFNLNAAPVQLPELKRMAAALAHRGPDGEGFYTDNNAGLAHQRLAIIDTSGNASQPFTSGNKEWVIVFNGCIYNFKALKKELQEKGHLFISTSDTEVIAEGLAAYGASFFEKLNGMFAVAAYNTTTKNLWLSRDKYGIKPLYWYFVNGVFLFASEIKAFIHHPAFKAEVNLQALNEYFTFQNLFSHHTLFKNVHLLPAATTININTETSAIKYHAWWDYDFSTINEKMSFEEATIETERLLQQAVQRQLVSNVPVGSYLSGGIDSGAIATIASKQIRPLSTFTAGFEMSGIEGVEAGYDEREDAAAMAKFSGTQHYEHIIQAKDLRNILPRVVWHIEDLKVGMSYPNYYISKLASKHVKVCLQGTGGDELYGGYPWRYYRVFKSLDKKTYYNEYYNFWQRLVPDEEKPDLFQQHIYGQLDNAAPRFAFEQVFEQNKSLLFDTPEHHIQNSLYFEIKTFLQGLFLVGDKLSMANGLEERYPFMDDALVNFAQSVPVKYKLGNLELMKRLDENQAGPKTKIYQQYDDGKNVLRQAMQHILPPGVINRKKQGFSAPDENWYRGENAGYIKDLLLSKDLSCEEFINPGYIRRIVDEHINKRINHRLLLWSFMNFEWWCRLFLHNQSLPE